MWKATDFLKIILKINLRVYGVYVRSREGMCMGAQVCVWKSQDSLQCRLSGAHNGWSQSVPAWHFTMWQALHPASPSPGSGVWALCLAFRMGPVDLNLGPQTGKGGA